ncbi:MAG: hypothetical protein HRT58_09140 [Crocinitomicaceae bacterium]|nr:hypothetical protein [Flavobacteriales bacterium]NQZ35817.1 hypothetical protein [Crocinitomicaceae bacterium]
MKIFLFVILVIFSFRVGAQERCDCCNLYLTNDTKLWESFFIPSIIRKTKTSAVTLDYSFIDSNGISKKEPILVFSFNSKGYVIEVTEYYDGLINHSVNFIRKHQNRIKLSKMNYLDEDGNILYDFLETITDFSYSKNGMKIKERSSAGEIIPDSIANNLAILKYNRDGLLIESFRQYHFENGGDEGDYHSENRTNLELSPNGRSGIRNSFSEDTLWTVEKLVLNEAGEVKSVELFYASDTSEVINVTEYEYNSDGQFVLMKNTNPVNKIFTECTDHGSYELIMSYKHGLLESILYTFADNERKISCSYH